MCCRCCSDTSAGWCGRCCRNAISRLRSFSTEEELMSIRRSAIALVAVLAVLLAAATAPVPAQDKLKVLASFSILGDFVRSVGGDRVEVSLLVPPNGDAHVYSPSPSDARKVAAAKVVIINGLGFEGWMPRLVKASGS